MDRGGLLIGEVAQRSGVSRKAVRQYEARGILPPAHRTPSGYRVYPAAVVGILPFVEQGRRLGLTLAEVRQIVALRRSGCMPCVHVRHLLEQKAADLAN
jgi:DNA-binding transcriptional MerR regulator